MSESWIVSTEDFDMLDWMRVFEIMTEKQRKDFFKELNQ